ncbi:MAG: tail fiber domain-containing protein, partial [Flavobacteriales bacterium]
SNTSGNSNVAIGQEALFYNTTGSSNVAMGFSALTFNTSGGRNTALGNGALISNTTSFDNSALGYAAMDLNTTGYGNTAMGRSALYSNSSGHSNVAIGFEAGYYQTAGSNSTFIGIGSGPVDGSGSFSYSIALGEYSTVTATDQIRIGSSFTTSIGGYQAWSNLSDGRMKKDVANSAIGLDFIMKLRPVTYHMDQSAIIEKLYANNPEVLADRRKRLAEYDGNQLQTGFIAQEVEAAARELGYDFSGVDAPKNADDMYGLRYAEFTVPLVKAVQEQQAMIKELQDEVAELKTTLNQLQAKR